MTEERVTLRIDADLLTEIDTMVDGDRNIASRSHFFRVAAEEFLRIQKGKGRAAIRIPELLQEALDAEVAMGAYSTVDEIIADCLRKRYSIEAEDVKKIVKERMELNRRALQVVRK